jgi:hypothetical protein
MFRHQLLNFLKTDLNPKIKTILGDLSLVSLIIFAIFSWINYANPIYIQPTGTLPDPQTLQTTSKLIPGTFLILLLSLTSLLLFLKDKIRRNLDEFLKYGFLISLLTVTIGSLSFEFIQTTPILNNIVTFLKTYILPTSIISIIFGFFLFYRNRETIDLEIEKEELEEKQAEQTRLQEFPTKFPKINKIPALRGIVKWGYKEEWIYILGLFSLIFIGILIRLKEIFAKSPWADEGFSILVAQRIFDGFGHTMPSGNLYPRAFLYHEYLSFFANFSEKLYGFGVIANIPFFIISCFVIYYLTKKFSQKKYALLAILFFIFSWFSIAHFRMIRMYEAFLAFFLLMFYFLIIIIQKYYNINSKISFNKKIKKLFQQNLFIFLMFFIFFYLSYQTQVITASIIPSLIIANLLFFIIKPKIKSFIFLIVSALIWITGLVYIYKENFYKYLIKQNSPDWVENYAVAPFDEFWFFLINNQHSYLIILLILLIPLVFTNFNLSKKKIPLFYLLFITFGYYAIISLQGVGSVASRYFYPFLPLSIIIFSIFSFYLVKIFFKQKNKIYLVLILIFLLFLNLYASGIKESASIIPKNSKLGVNNFEYREFFNKIQEKNIDLENNIIGGDGHIIITYYIHTKNKPHFVVIRDKARFQKSNFYLDIPEIGYEDLNDLTNKTKKENVYFLYDGDWNKWQEGKKNILENKHKTIVEYGNMKLIKYQN